MANLFFGEVTSGTSNPGITTTVAWHNPPHDSVWSAWCVTEPFDLSAGNKTGTTKGEILGMHDDFKMTEGLDTAKRNVVITFKIDGNGKAFFDIFIARIFA